jgi:hypothetical protein
MPSRALLSPSVRLNFRLPFKEALKTALKVGLEVDKIKVPRLAPTISLGSLTVLISLVDATFNGG